MISSSLPRQTHYPGRESTGRFFASSDCAAIISAIPPVARGCAGYEGDGAATPAYRTMVHAQGKLGASERSIRSDALPLRVALTIRVRARTRRRASRRLAAADTLALAAPIPPLPPKKTKWTRKPRALTFHCRLSAGPRRPAKRPRGRRARAAPRLIRIQRRGRTAPSPPPPCKRAAASPRPPRATLLSGRRPDSARGGPEDCWLLAGPRRRDIGVHHAPADKIAHKITLEPK